MTYACFDYIFISDKWYRLLILLSRREWETVRTSASADSAHKSTHTWKKWQISCKNGKHKFMLLFILVCLGNTRKKYAESLPFKNFQKMLSRCFLCFDLFKFTNRQSERWFAYTTEQLLFSSHVDAARSGEKYETSSTNIGYSKYMKLKIRSVGPNDYGFFRCVAKNSLGETDGRILLEGKLFESN